MDYKEVLDYVLLADPAIPAHSTVAQVYLSLW